MRVKVAKLYKQIKPPLVGEHAFPLTGFVCKEAHVTLQNRFEVNGIGYSFSQENDNV